MPSRWVLFAVISLCLLMTLTAACVFSFDARPESCPDGFRSHVELQLFFGLEDGDGNRVGDEEWAEFQENVITPLFPAGMTVADAAGQWLEPSGELQREDTRLVRGLMAQSTDEAVSRANIISDKFVQQFDQDPVFRVMNEVCSGVR